MIATACVLLVVIAAFRAWRERSSTPFRRQIVALALRGPILVSLLWIAINPTAIRPEHITGRPKLVILLDRSTSMATQDMGGASRFDAAVKLLTDAAVRSSLTDQFTLDTRCFDGRTFPSDLDRLATERPTGDTSDIGAAVTEAVMDQVDLDAQAGVILISDGRATQGAADDAARLALARGVPLWTWQLGGEVPRQDLWMEVPCSELLVFSNSQVELAGTVKHAGFEHRTFAVELLRDDEVVQRFEVNPQQDDGRVHAIVTAPEVGEQRYSFRAVPVAGEADTQNNQRSIFVRSVGDKVRVFLAEGQPHWDTKFLVQTLKRSDRVELTAVYRLGPDRQFAVVTSSGDEQRKRGDFFPRAQDDYGAYDVLIFGRGCETFFDDQTEPLLTQFVAERGGGLVFSRGKSYGGRFTPLAKFEPIVWGRGAAQAVALVPKDLYESGPLEDLVPGGDLNAMLDRLPRFDQAQQTRGVKPLAIVMAEGEAARSNEPDDELVLMAYQLYGQGRVLTVNASGLWRWAFRDKGEDSDEFIYDRLWSGLLRWLIAGSDFVAGDQIALRSARRAYTDQQPMQFLIRTRQIDATAYKPHLTIEGQGVHAEIDPRADGDSTWFAQVGPFPTGTYAVKLTNNVGIPETVTTSVDVVSGSIEQRQLSADPQLMQQLAEVSQGRVLDPDDITHFASMYRGWQAEHQLSENKRSLWDRWWLLTIALGMVAVEWFVRRQEGLL
jgi:hypothetical protein